MDVAIVGAGLAGLTCATMLREAGHAVALFDKGRGPGGRMSSRRVGTPAGEAGFDHGAQYFTARDPGFAAVVAAWQREGLVAPWPAAGADCWVGTPAMNAPVRDLARNLEVRWNVRIDMLAGAPGAWRLLGDAFEAGPFETVLLAVPSENAAALLAPVAPDFAARALATPAQPCWTLMAAFGGRVPLEADVLRERGAIGWAARNSAKPGRGGPEAWVIQAGPDWSAAHLELAPADAARLLLAAFAESAFPMPPLLSAAAHRWRYARSGRAGEGHLWDPARSLGVCGDWLLGPRVECAWLSGSRLAASIAG